MFPPFILFDLDDTLFDHAHASQVALAHVHAAHAPEIAFEPFARQHAFVLERYHQRFLAGEFTLDEARANRMIELFATFERRINTEHAAEIGALYRREHQANRKLVEGARELLDALQPRARMAIVTNNSVAEQIEKLCALDIARYFDTIVISEDVGVTKPDTKIFALALERLGAKAHEAVMIGDSLANDIAGAITAGIAPVWLNRKTHETPVSTGFNRQNIVEPPAKSGLSIDEIITIKTLAPITTALAAIETAFSKHSPGTKETPNAKLATLAS